MIQACGHSVDNHIVSGKKADLESQNATEGFYIK